jgi:uncharacterized membrane protein
MRLIYNFQTFSGWSTAMMKTLHEYFLNHLYRLALVAMLAIVTLFSIVLVRVRLSENDGTHYSYLFLIRNLLLAWIPLLVALITESLIRTRRIFYFIFPLGCLIWLICLPNAPYLLTDFQHLRLYSGSPKIWFDVIMVIWVAFTGLFLGLVSLYVMHRLVKRQFGRTVGWAFVCTAALLSSVGIYIGRFLRFSSWNILLTPSALADDLLKEIVDSGSRILGFVSLYTLFFVFIYITFYVFGNVLHEDSRE